MLLKMTLGDQIIDSVPVEPYRCKQVGYLEAMQRCLKLKHLHKVVESGETPRFYLEAYSRMNESDFEAND